MTVNQDLFWTYYFGKDIALDSKNVGKWMYFFDCYKEGDKVELLCKKAIETSTVSSCKHTNLTTLAINPNIKEGKGVCCFYLNGADMEQHKKVLRYFIDNDMIPKTRAGRFYNISFKYDAQTKAGEYGEDFVGTIKLDQFIDLYTGDWLTETASNRNKTKINEGGISIPPSSKKRIAIIDVETNFYDQMMSLGMVVATVDTFEPIDCFYYIFDDEIEVGGMYSDALYKPDINPVHVRRVSTEWFYEVDNYLKSNGIDSIYAYNARFDYSHVRELEHYMWFDIMKIAANINYNKSIPSNAEVYKSGRMKRGYGVEKIYRLLSHDESYYETHNALLDAIDELEIMKMMGVDIQQYNSARINPIDPSLKRRFHVGDLVETEEDGVGTIKKIDELTQILLLEVAFSSGTKAIPGLLTFPKVIKAESDVILPNTKGTPLFDYKESSPSNSKEIKQMIKEKSQGRLHASNYKMMTGQITITCVICGHQWTSKYYEVTVCPRCSSKWPGENK